MTSTCGIPLCSRPAKARGICQAHRSERERVRALLRLPAVVVEPAMAEAVVAEAEARGVDVGEVVVAALSVHLRKRLRTPA